MPPHTWATDAMRVAQTLEAKVIGSEEAGALIAHAAWCVDALHYQLDLDARSRAESSLGHNADTADVAHVRWATSTAITALDLCAAALGRVYCGVTGPHEHDLRTFDEASRDAKRARAARAAMAALPVSASAWVRAVLADSTNSAPEIRSRTAGYLDTCGSEVGSALILAPARCQHR